VFELSGSVPLLKSSIGAALAGACMAAAAPAMASSGEAAASPSTPDTYRPLIFDRSAVPARRAIHPMILSRPASPDVFGTVALKAGVTFYDARFRRVAAADARDPLVQRLAAGAANLDPVGKLRLVQQEISQQVRWMHDLDNMGVADFWANAGETLRRGTGDSEDIACEKNEDCPSDEMSGSVGCCDQPTKVCFVSDGDKCPAAPGRGVFQPAYN